MIAESEKLNPISGGHVWWQRVWRYGPLLLWMAFITFASTGEFSAENTSRIIGPLVHWLFPDFTPEQIRHVHFLIRKAAHFSEYAVFALLAARALATSSRAVLQHGWFFISLLLVISYALIDEYHQSFVISRTASIYDSFIDMSGGLTVLLLYALWHKHRARVRSRRSKVADEAA